MGDNEQQPISHEDMTCAAVDIILAKCDANLIGEGVAAKLEIPMVTFVSVVHDGLGERIRAERAEAQRDELLDLVTRLADHDTFDEAKSAVSDAREWLRANARNNESEGA